MMFTYKMRLCIPFSNICRCFSLSNRIQNSDIAPIDDEDAFIQKQITDELFGGREKPQIKPEESSTLLFPGQGSQYVGMARNLLQYQNVKEMFDVASEIFDFKLLELCIRGPKTELDKTMYCQPAVVVTALAGIEKLQAESPKVLENCLAVAGYSVGEYAALVFSGALSFEDAMNLVKIRANEMQNASNDTGGGMISAIGGARTKFNMACSDAVEYCQDQLGMMNVICKVSGYLAPNVRTIAGHRAALEYLSSQKQNYHIRKVQILPVSGAFHSVLMKPAVKKIRETLKTIEVKDPLVTVYSNIDGKPYKDSDDIVKKLPDQIVKPVHWEQTMHAMYGQWRKVMPLAYELGPGHQLGTLLRKCNGKAWKNYLSVDERINKVDPGASEG